MKCLKIIFSLLLMVSLCACDNNETELNTNEEQNSTNQEVIDEPFVLNDATLEEMMLMDSEEIYKLLNILSFDNIEISEVTWESVYRYINMNINNTSEYDIVLTDLKFITNKVGYEMEFVTHDGSILSNTNNKYEMCTKKLLDNIVFDILDYYTYQLTTNDFVYNVKVMVGNERAEISKRNYNKPEPPIYANKYMANGGYTVFVWQDDENYSFDILEGIEYDGCVNKPLYLSDDYVAVYDKIRYLDIDVNSKPFFIFNAYESEVTDDMKIYIDNIMKQFEYAYAFADELEKIETAKTEYASFYNFYIIMNGEEVSKGVVCDYEYCLFGGYVNNFEYHFTEEQKASLQKGRYTVEQLTEFVESHSEYDFVAVGAEGELSSDARASVNKLITSDGYDYLYKIDTKKGQLIGADKPAIYLYPEKETKVYISIESNGNLLTTYPKYENGWNVIAKPDGTIYDLRTNREYEYLFWEGESYTNYDMSKGFVIAKEDTVDFLEEKLAYMGLNNEEINEFIVYWLPQLEKNSYNFITFQDEIYTNTWKLNVTPTPDTMIRIFMTWYGLDEPINVEEPTLSKGERNGYTLVEWGGVEIK